MRVNVSPSTQVNLVGGLLQAMLGCHKQRDKHMHWSLTPTSSLCACMEV
jgi:hypothetical protein